MIQPFKKLRRTITVDAVRHCLAFFVDNRLMAGWALIRIVERLFFACSLLQDRADNLRDYVARALDHHHVADSNIFSADVVFVVEGSKLDSHAAEFYRFQDGVWVHRSSSADIDADLFQPGS